MNLSELSLEDIVLPAMLLLIAGFAWWAWQIKRDSPTWPSVEGEILTARAYARNETGDQRGTPTHEWLTEVSYRYTVGGVTYTGNRIRAFGPLHFDEASALTEIRPFPVGAKVPVYYRPDSPSTSVLIPG